jgi:hypothetical protein
MLKVHALKYLQLGRNLSQVSSVLLLSEGLKKPLREKDFAEMRARLEMLAQHCEELELSTSVTMTQKALKDLPKTYRELEIYISTVTTEIEHRTFFFVPPDRAKYYDYDFGQKLPAAFPKCTVEFQHAGKCYAVAEFTACVFHCMRAAEIVLRALADDVGIVTPTDVTQWQNLIEQIESTIKKLGQQPKTPKRDADLQFYSTAAAQFRYLKDAWRNHVAHAKVVYGEVEALKIFEHAKDLVEGLAGKLKEPT